MNTPRPRHFQIMIKWAATVNIQALLDFVQCAPSSARPGVHQPSAIFAQPEMTLPNAPCHLQTDIGQALISAER